MEAPEFAQSEKLRRVFAALENRAYLGEPDRQRRRLGRVQVFIGRENAAAEMRDVSLVLAPYGRAGRGHRRRRRARPDAHVLSPGDRHGPLRVRSDERTGGPPVRLTTMTSPDRRHGPQDPRRGARRRARHLPGRAPRPEIERADAPSATRAHRPGGRVPAARSSASAPSSRTSSAGPTEERERDARPRRRGPASARSWPSPTTSTAPSRHAPATDRRRPVGRGHRRHRPQAAPAARERGRDGRSRRRPGTPVRPARARGDRQRPGHRPRRTARSSTRSGAATGSATASSARRSSPSPTAAPARPTATRPTHRPTQT